MCSGKRCEVEACAKCFTTLEADGPAVPINKPCTDGACPRCGGTFVEWLSFDVEPSHVLLNCEIVAGVRAVPKGRLVIRERPAPGSS